MTNHGYSDDDFDRFESAFDPLQADRKARRARNPRPDPRAKKGGNPDREAVDNMDQADVVLETGFKTTYEPARFERGWLLESLTSFYDQALISDVLSMVKGGKEASVYRCVANPATGHTILAAKVYRPRQFRNLRNDALYREGREYLASEGGSLNEGDQREMRAIRNKSNYGVQLQHGSWLNYEYTTLDMLYKAGAAVPQPIAMAENAILMGYIGDESMAAPTLSQVKLDPDESLPLFNQVIDTIQTMLKAGWIHGDLSAYNILYWDGQITVIDFPQVTSATANRSARAILGRDVQRVCEYFIRQGVRCDHRVVLDRLWKTYMESGVNLREAELSRIDPAEREGRAQKLARD